jgi:hypothetical protein
MEAREKFDDYMVATDLGTVVSLVAIAREVGRLGGEGVFDRMEMFARRELEQAIALLPSEKREQSRIQAEKIIRDIFRNAQPS